jgi:hypothetical protein
MPVVKVLIAKCCTVPKSARTSISTSAVPPAIAGRASGSATRKKAEDRPWPSVREHSIRQVDCCRNAARQSR